MDADQSEFGGVAESGASRLGRSTSVDPPRIDLGVIDATRGSYRCVPFAQLGIDPRVSVVSIESTCECIVPRVVRYIDLSGAQSPAMWIEYVPESSSLPSTGSDDGNPVHEDTQYPPRLLHVNCTAAFENGDRLVFRVEFLDTTVAGETR